MAKCITARSTGLSSLCAVQSVDRSRRPNSQKLHKSMLQKVIRFHGNHFPYGTLDIPLDVDPSTLDAQGSKLIYVTKATGSHLDRPGRAIQASGGTLVDPDHRTVIRGGNERG